MNGRYAGLAECPLVPHLGGRNAPPQVEHYSLALRYGYGLAQRDEQREPGEHAWRVRVGVDGDGVRPVQHAVEVAGEAVDDAVRARREADGDVPARST
jgi:hypothetical protein